jgi:hypothetical protein
MERTACPGTPRQPKNQKLRLFFECLVVLHVLRLVLQRKPWVKATSVTRRKRLSKNYGHFMGFMMGVMGDGIDPGCLAFLAGFVLMVFF